MITTQTEIVTSYPMSPLNTAATLRTVQEIDAETRHRIYDRVLTLSANPQIRVKKTGAVLPYILHPKTKAALMKDGFSVSDIADLEGEIIEDADKHLNNYEVSRSVPAALYRALKADDAEDLISDNRIVPLPNLIMNALICAELQKEFSQRTLLSCEGFIEVCSADEETGIIDKAIRLDIDGWIVRNGFMMPVYREGLIRALEIFRHPKDEYPFWLKSRIEGDYAS